mmetsp:Transcript_29086/g.38245  ORF Transcript_29086/g.38245 Transcript_29086/m.38245 type:complete len:587 (+) Transcript_29086:70-1830(+)
MFKKSNEGALHRTSFSQDFLQHPSLSVDHPLGDQQADDGNASVDLMCSRTPSLSMAEGILEDDDDQTPLLKEEGVWMSQELVGRMKRNYEGQKPAEGFYGLVEKLYGDLPWSEMPRIAWLSLTLFCIIGGFWILDSLKDSIFENTVGIEYQPKAKVVSAAITIVLVAVYNHLVDRIEKHQLFYVLGGFYSIVFWMISILLTNSKIGLGNSDISPSRLIGWISYIAIESYGSFAVALFWAFVNASVNISEAESAYGLIIAGAQIGAIIGATVATQVKHFHPVSLYQVAATSPIILILMIWAYVQIWPRSLPESCTPGKPVGLYRETSKSGNKNIWSKMLDGVLLIFRHRYVLLLLGMSCIDEIVLTVLDYEMKLVGAIRFKGRVDDFTLLLARFGQATNIVSLGMSLLGTSLIIRHLGLPKSLIVFPILLMSAVIIAYLFPRLWVLFICMSILKGLTYSLYEPCIEMLFLPTSEEIKFKCKGWIDVVGARGAKALGSLITITYGKNPRNLATYGGLPSFLISLILMMVTVAIGEQFDDLQRAGKVVGMPEGNEETIQAIEMAFADKEAPVSKASNPYTGPRFKEDNL